MKRLVKIGKMGWRKCQRGRRGRVDEKSINRWGGERLLAAAIKT